MNFRVYKEEALIGSGVAFVVRASNEKTNHVCLTLIEVANFIKKAREEIRESFSLYFSPIHDAELREYKMVGLIASLCKPLSLEEQKELLCYLENH